MLIFDILQTVIYLILQNSGKSLSRKFFERLIYS